MSLLTLVILLALLLVGCGSGNNAVSSASTAKLTARAVLTIKWPVLSRLIPVASTSIKITIANDRGFSTSQIVNRPTNVPPTSIVTFNEIAPGNLFVTATAYPLINATGTAQATGTATEVIMDGQTALLTLTMHSTITQVIVTPNIPIIAVTETVQLVATPENSADEMVLVAPGNISWTSSDPTVATVNPSTGQVTGVKVGSTTLTATESDSHVSGTMTVRVMAVIISPVTATIVVSTTKQFTAAVTGIVNTNVTWSVVGGNVNGTITAAGLYTAPAAPGTYQVTATSVGDPTQSDTATVTVVPAAVVVSVSISPNTAAIYVFAAQQFTATVAGSANGAVSWTVVEGNAGGIITALGRYTAPATAGTYHVKATSVADPTKSDTATVTVQPVPPVVVTISPTTATVAVSTTKQFTASVLGTTNTAITWSVVGGNVNGTITAAGLYTAPATGGAYQVKATSVADPTSWDIATVTVPPVVVTTSPSTATIAVSTSQQFTATVAGTTNQTVAWTVVGGNVNGTITAAGLYTAPTTAGTYQVKATSAADLTKSDTVTVTVPPVVVTTSPATATIAISTTKQFTATVAGTLNTNIIWTVVGGNVNGTITAAGL